MTPPPSPQAQERKTGLIGLKAVNTFVILEKQMFVRMTPSNLG